ncbi:hypothetical protein V3M63_06705 [Trueperella pyogenes]|uniref:hypothetical protein n=1 Tax=Trueperella pyogenes TaxID=1661 RepID=UPI00345C9B88
MTDEQLVAEAQYAATLTRLEHLISAGVLTAVQAANIATRVADRTGAVLGGLNARMLVDLSATPSDL